MSAGANGYSVPQVQDWMNGGQQPQNEVSNIGASMPGYSLSGESKPFNPSPLPVYSGSPQGDASGGVPGGFTPPGNAYGLGESTTGPPGLRGPLPPVQQGNPNDNGSYPTPQPYVAPVAGLLGPDRIRRPLPPYGS